MYCNLAKNPLLTSNLGSFACGFSQIGRKPCRLRRYSDAVARPLRDQTVEGVVGLMVLGTFIPEFRDYPFRVRVRSRRYHGAPHQIVGGNGSGGISGDSLPWIAAYNGRKVKVSEEKAAGRAGVSSWEESASKYFSKRDRSPIGGRGESARIADVERSREVGGLDEGGDADGEEDEPVDDPRWDKIKSNYNKLVGREKRYERPEVARLSRQENWARKTWKEATASSVPKMVGEAVYGVGPVMAALMVGRREFYALYVQEGMDLSGLNRKKKRKDRKGIESIFKMAEKLGLVLKETSKHDLNMVVDNRPHQGLILDASPLEMVSIKEMEPVSITEGRKAPVWVALDEVTDPQNLGAILRSCYFFGVGGVVVCAKNSAPLSGVVSKASAGSLELIELRTCKNMMQFLSASVENGWRVLGGSVSSKARTLTEVQPGVPTILVLGSEGSGLRPLVERSCTDLVKIPGGVQLELDACSEDDDTVEGDEMGMSSLGQEFKPFIAVESLNVSVAAGVLLYHLIGSCGSSVSANEVNDP